MAGGKGQSAPDCVTAASERERQAWPVRLEEEDGCNSSSIAMT
jgi:hypothetical protein